MMIVRELNDDGMAAAVELLDALRRGVEARVPTDFLELPSWSRETGLLFSLPREGEIRTRWQLGLWLHRGFGAENARSWVHRPGMWTWLAFRLFDLLCPANPSGRAIKENARYILARGDYRKSYRHLLAGPYFLIDAHDGTPAVVKSLLSTAPSAPGEVYEQLASRSDLVRSHATMQVVTNLYWDRTSDKLKRGAAGAGPGSARRLADVLMQFELTFDLYAVSAQRLDAMLPMEFSKFQQG
jgi:hypothetical protein